MKKGNLLTLFIIVFLDMVGIGIMSPVVAPLMLDPTSALVPANWSESAREITIGFLVATFPLAQFFGAPILGTLSDRFGRKKLLLISTAGTLIGYLLFAFGLLTNQLWLLFGSRALDGFTGGNVGVANSAIADMSSLKNRAKNFGLIGMAFGFGFIIGPFIGGTLADSTVLPWFNAATPFYAAALFSLLSMLLLVFQFQETLKKRFFRRVHVFMGFKDIAKAFRMHNLKVMFAVIFLHMAGFSFFTHLFPVFLVEKFDYTSAQIGTLFAYVGVWIAIGQGLVTRWVARYLVPEKVLRFSFLLLSVFLYLITLLPNPLILYWIQPFLAIFEGLSFPNGTAVISRISSPEEQGEIMGVTQSLRALAQALPPMLGGFLLTIHSDLAILTGAGIILLAWAIFMLSFRPNRIVLSNPL